MDDAKAVVLDPVERGFHVEVLPRRPDLPPDVRDAVEAHWNALLARGAPFHRGTIHSAVEVRVRSGNVHVRVERSDYAHYLYALHHDPAPTHAVRAVYAACLLVTADGRYVVGEMARDTAFPGRWQLPGGNLDADDARPGALLDAYAGVCREVREEVGVDVEDPGVARAVAPSLLKTGGAHGAVGLVFRADLALDAPELQRCFDRHVAALRTRGESPELQGLRFVPADVEAVEGFLQGREAAVDSLAAVLRWHARREAA